MHKYLKNIWLPYTQMKGFTNVDKVVKTSETEIFLENEKKLIDGISSWWTVCHGYNNKHITKQIIKQLNVMPHVMFGGLVHNQAITLAKRISKLLKNNLEKVFFCDSGSVSIEIALKMSIQFWINKGKRNKNRFVHFWNGYHGDTSGAMSVCDPDEGMHSIFKKNLQKNIITKLPESSEEKNIFEKVIKNNKDKLAGIIVEPLIQCAGGMKIHHPEVLNYLNIISKKYKVLLIYDEIATGFGRTGTMFAFQQTNSAPDIICLGKALTGGFLSLAATVATKDVFNAFLGDKYGLELMHGPTYMANALACAAANASLDIFEKKNILQKVKKIEDFFISELNKFKEFEEVQNVRVKGAVGVIELRRINAKDLKWLKKEFLREGVWIRPLRNVIYFMPAFNITMKKLQLIIDATFRVLKRMELKKSNEKYKKKTVK